MWKEGKSERETKARWKQRYLVSITHVAGSSKILHKQLLNWRHSVKFCSSKIMSFHEGLHHSVTYLSSALNPLDSFTVESQPCDSISVTFWQAKKCHKALPYCLPFWNSPCEGCCVWPAAGNSAPPSPLLTLPTSRMGGKTGRVKLN